ncbi:hypothetical protein [Cypionkella sp. TWP1-2-1b2]|uniref:hypothetical protein n=1 Tax=Cypionkella sp. TWP1-2-1b2 TaxID=2804675 RepID=UPI003CEE4C04
MTKRPFLTTARSVAIFDEMISCRREYCADTDFFRMTDFWEDQCDDEGRWQINKYRSDETEDFKRKAGVIAFDYRVTLSVDEKLMANAKRGCMLSNFILAHEMGHVALGHHLRSATTKNFQLFDGPRGMCNLPPTLEELEANYAGTFLQCGVALFDSKWSPLDLARRAFTNVEYVRKSQRIVGLEVFQRELVRPKPNLISIVL